jgi:opacity protein-like surface antigen
MCAFALSVCSSTLFAAMPSVPSFATYTHSIIAFQGGFSCLGASEDSQSFLGSGGNTFTYNPHPINCQTPIIGAFFGNEYRLNRENKRPLFLQVGFDYTHFSDTNMTGSHSVGITPAFTQYNYQSSVKTEQLLADFKLLTIMANTYYPYAEAAIGVAINKSENYHYSTDQGGALNLTPDFNNLKTSKLSFAVGLGLEKDVKSHIKASLGYRFSYLGNASLGAGAISTGANDVPVAFTLDTKHLYANQLLARVSYTA